MNRKEICPDFKEDSVFRKGKRKEICGYFDLDTNTLCQHPNHTVCLFYFEKHNIKDPWLRNIMNEFGLVKE